MENFNYLAQAAGASYKMTAEQRAEENRKMEEMRQSLKEEEDCFWGATAEEVDELTEELKKKQEEVKSKDISEHYYAQVGLKASKELIDSIVKDIEEDNPGIKIGNKIPLIKKIKEALNSGDIISIYKKESGA